MQSISEFVQEWNGRDTGSEEDPVILCGDHLGITYWCAPLLLSFAKDLLVALRNETIGIPEAWKDHLFSDVTKNIILVNPDCYTALNCRSWNLN